MLLQPADVRPKSSGPFEGNLRKKGRRERLRWATVTLSVNPTDVSVFFVS